MHEIRLAFVRAQVVRRDKTDAAHVFIRVILLSPDVADVRNVAVVYVAIHFLQRGGVRIVRKLYVIYREIEAPSAAQISHKRFKIARIVRLRRNGSVETFALTLEEHHSLEFHLDERIGKRVIEFSGTDLSAELVSELIRQFLRH